MTQVGDLTSVLERIGTWRVNGYTAQNNAAGVAAAIEAGYAREGAERYELTEAGAALLAARG